MNRLSAPEWFYAWGIVLLATVVSHAEPPAKGAEGVAGQTTLGIQGSRFTLNGKPRFLLGISYYGGLGASEDAIRKDLDDIQKCGFNWLRVWATWAAFGNDVSAVEGDGRARESQLRKLQALVAECDRLGMVVDVTLSRGNGVTGPPRLQTLESHRRAAVVLTASLQPWRRT